MSATQIAPEKVKLRIVAPWKNGPHTRGADSLAWRSRPSHFTRADFFDGSEQTINAWKDAHPEFLESLKDGKAKADAEVADKLFRRATATRTKR